MHTALNESLGITWHNAKARNDDVAAGTDSTGPTNQVRAET